MNQKPILVIGAMEPEINYLIKKLENIEKEKLNIYKVYKGTIKEYPVIIAQSEVGIINSSSLTALAIEKYNPFIIINEGTAGGFGKDVHKGDIIIGVESFNIMSAKTPCKEERKGSNSLEWDYITFVNGGKDEKKTIKASKELVTLVEGIKEKYTKGNVHKGVIGSGDIWNREKDKIMYLNQKHNVLCEEMEGIAVYTIAQNYNIPVLGIRIISDNEILAEEYDRNLGLECQKFVYEILKEVINKRG